MYNQSILQWRPLAVAMAALTLAACGGASTQATATPSAAAATTLKPAAAATSGPSSLKQTPVAANDVSGTVLTAVAGGTIDHGNVFFQPLGNGRSCGTCHQEGQSWSVTPAAIKARFQASNGNDPIFRLNDGANSPAQRIATAAQQLSAYSMLLNRGVFRVGLGMPSVADFSLVTVDDPYGYASAQELSLYRRPLPSTNLGFESTIMWDGRQTLASTATGAACIAGQPGNCFASIGTDLQSQANSAVQTHAQFAAGLTTQQQQSVAAFEQGLTTAQATDKAAGNLAANGGNGGPAALAAGSFYFGINDVVAGDYQTKAPFNPTVFTLFNAWAPVAPPRLGFPPPPAVAGVTAAQAAIGRGQDIFNHRPMAINGVPGFNDAVGQPQVRGTCSSCHDVPNVGSASVPRLMNTGIAAPERRTPDMPLYTFKTANGASVQTTDPGQALITGKAADIGKFKVPGLRGLAARGPYFHDGSAKDLAGVVRFYNNRFKMNLSPGETSDLVAFLSAL